MAITLIAHVLVLEVIIVRLTVSIPMGSIAVVASAAHQSAALIFAVIKQFVPSRAIEVAYGTLVMVVRVSDVLVERVPGTILSVAAVAKANGC